MKLRLQARYWLVVLATLAAMVVVAVAHFVGFRSMLSTVTSIVGPALTDALNQQVILLYLLALVVVALGLGLGFVWVRNISHRIGALSLYTRTMGIGNDDAPPPLKGADELSLLAQDIRLMGRNLKRLEEVSHRANLGELTAEMVHELKQPLNTILLAVDNALLSREYGNFDPDFIDAKLRLISQQVAGMDELLQRMSSTGAARDTPTAVE